MISNSTSTYLKLSIVDLFLAELDTNNDILVCKLHSSSGVCSLLVQKVRLSGVVTELTSNCIFLDDGSGVIKLEYEELQEKLSIGDFICVLGVVKNGNPLSVKVHCYSIKRDPMEEVKHMLEQSVLHRDIMKYYNFNDETYLSSQPVMSDLDSVSMSVYEALKTRDQNVGLPFSEVYTMAGGEEQGNQAIVALEMNSMAYRDNNTLFII